MSHVQDWDAPGLDGSDPGRVGVSWEDTPRPFSDGCGIAETLSLRRVN